MFATPQAAFGGGDYTEVFRLLDCAIDRLWPTLGWWGGGTLMLGQWFVKAKLAQALSAKGSALTVLEENALYRQNPIPFCIRAAGH